MHIEEHAAGPGGPSVGLGGLDETSWLELVFRKVPGGIWATDTELKIVWAIGRERGVECPLDELRGMSVYQYLDASATHGAVVDACHAALRGKRSKLCAWQGERCYDVAIEPLLGEGEAVLGTVGVAVDVTEQERARAAEVEALSLLRATLNSTADGLLVVDRAGKVTAFNERFLTLWRIPAELAESRDDQRLLASVLDQLADPEAFMRRVRELYSLVDEESFDVLRFSDGRVFERLSRPQRVGDAVVGRVWSFRDVTDRESLLVRTQLLADAGRLLGTLDVEPALESVARLAARGFADATAVDLFTNGGAHRLVTVTTDERIVDELNGIPPPVLAGRTSLSHAEHATRITVPVVARGHLLAVLSFLVRPPRGYVAADLSTAEELGARCALALENARLYRETCTALAARDEMLAIVAHEIRGPLTSMRLAAETLKKRSATALDARALDLLERENRRMARFVDELLDAVRFHAGRVRFDLEDVDLGEVVRFVCARMAPELERSGSVLSVTTDASVVGAWDRARLDQVVTNLLSNAVKFGEGRPIGVTLTSSGGVATLEVEDHGIGIPRAEQETIFDPFERAVGAHHYGGLGLGLYIVRTILEGLGGGVVVESEPARGTRFTVTLPLAREAR